MGSAVAQQAGGEQRTPRRDYDTREYISVMLSDGWSLVGRDPILLQRGRIQATVLPFR